MSSLASTKRCSHPQPTRPATGRRMGAPTGGLSAPSGKGSQDGSLHTSIVEREGSSTLAAARALAAQIDRLSLPSISAASPVKTVRPEAEAAWSVRIVHEGKEVPRALRSIPSVKVVERELKTSPSGDASGAWLRLGLTMAALYSGAAAAAGYAAYRAVHHLSAEEE